MHPPRLTYIAFVFASLFGLAGAVSAGPPGQSPPTNTAPPTISGTPQVGQTLTASQGNWSGPVQAYATQWNRCDSAGANCTAIGGATSTTYAPVAADVGSKLRVSVTASNKRGSTTATSDPTAAVQAASSSSPVAPTNTAAPTVSGTAQQGKTLTAAAGTWNGTQPLAYGYQWKRCDSSGSTCSALSGATSQSYTLGSADVNSTMRVDVTASNTAGASTATSSPTPTVTSAPTTISPATLPSGTVGVAYSQQLSASGPNPPYTFKLSVGSLPAGLTLSSAGLLSGTPSASGSFSFTVAAVDVTSATAATQAYALSIAPASSSGGTKLTWAPPPLTNPITVTAPSGGGTMYLDNTKDYIIKLGHVQYQSGSGNSSLDIVGGHNRVIIGGQITATPTNNTDDIRALLIDGGDPSGITHIEGVLIDQSVNGITLRTPQIVQIENVRIVSYAYHDDFTNAHPDIVQTWQSTEVRVDHLTGYSDYQGLTWMDATYGVWTPKKVTCLHCNIRALAPQPSSVSNTTGGKPILGQYAWHVWQSTVFNEQDCWAQTGWYSSTYQRKLDDSIGGFWNGTGYTQPPFDITNASGTVTQYSGDPAQQISQLRGFSDNLGRTQGDYMTWRSVFANSRWTWGVPPAGDFVPSGVAGVSYVSPGYN